MTAQQLQARIEKLAPETKAELIDLTGTQDHWQAIIVSPVFEGKSRIEQHKMIFELFKAEMETNEVHALTLKTFTPQQFERYKNGSSTHL